jgi:hypothetical protein
MSTPNTTAQPTLIDNSPIRRDVRAKYSGTSPYGQKLQIEVWLYPGQVLVVEDYATINNNQ